MRLKSLNFDKRSKSQSYNRVQQAVMQNVGDTMNSLGIVFDMFIELENFITVNILDETANLIKIREMRKEIEESQGLDVYLDDYFKPAANKLNEKLQDLLDQWDLTHEEHTVGSLTVIVENLKKVNGAINDLDNTGLLSTVETLNSIKSLVNEFGRFKVAKTALTNNIANRINLTLEARDKIIKYRDQIQKNKDDQDEDLSIDDL